MYRCYGLYLIRQDGYSSIDGTEDGGKASGEKMLFKESERLVISRMGGFTLIGPSYVFQNLPQHQQEQCRCLGFNGEISRQVEDILLNNRDQTLRLEDLPDDEYELLERLENTHLGTEMRYSIQKRAIPGKPLLQTRPVRIADV